MRTTSLQTALTRLSTGLQINTGADNPSGLIAAASLGSDITGVQQGINNSQLATEIISTADGGLSQVQQLLNTIQGLVNESANTGALSTDQIAANQLQVDSSLQAIDTIATHDDLPRQASARWQPGLHQHLARHPVYVDLGHADFGVRQQGQL